MSMDLAQIERLAKASRYDEALSACESLLRGGETDAVDILRTRAYVYARSGDYVRASMDREAVLHSGSPTIRDYYYAADQALKAENLELAHRRFDEVLQFGAAQNEDWFRCASLFYLAYIEIEQGDYEAASRHIALVKASEPECAMPLPNSCGMVSVKALEDEIRRHTA